MRAFDWSRTSLGPPDTSPQALRAAVSVCLSSRFPLVIWWGPELVQLYNDDYRWYDALVLVDGSVLLVIGEVSGQGLPAASVMGELRSAARSYALDGHSPAQLLRRLDALMRTTGRTFMATCLCLRLDAAAGRLTYASAGHPPALLRRADGTVDRLTGALAAPLGFLSGRRGERRRSGSSPATCSRCTPTAWWSAAAGRSTRGSTPSPAR
jgi:Stage II sporulation protein E (SpoIIE)